MEAARQTLGEVGHGALRLALAGLVALAAVPAAGQGRGTPTPPKAAPPAFPTVHFDVIMTVDSSAHTESPAGTDGLDVTDVTVRSSARWPNVGFSVISQNGKPIAMLPTSPSGFSGTLKAAATFAHHDDPKSYQPVNCAGNVPTQTYAADLGLLIYLALGGTTDKLTFLGLSHDAGLEFEQAILDAGDKAGCKWHTPGVPSFEFTLPDGIEFANSDALSLNWGVKNDGRTPFPIDQILAGRPFVIDPGRQTFKSDASTASNRQVQTSVRVEFTAPCATCNVPPLDTAPPPGPPCDPDLLADADRKWKVAQDLFAAGAEHLAEASKAFHDWKVEEAKTMAEIALEKNDLLKIVELALEEGGQHLLHAAAGWFGLASTAAWIYTDVYPHVAEHDQAVKDAAKMTETAAKLADEAIQDLKKRFAQASACDDLRQKAIAREKLLDQANALREKWALDGSALYKDPQDSSPYPMDAGAALNRAIQILTATSDASTRSASPPSSAQATETEAVLQSRATSPEGLAVTVGQGREALAQIDASLQIMTAGRDLLEKRNAFDESWGAALAALMAQWK